MTHDIYSTEDNAIHIGMSEEEYRSIDAINYSTVKSCIAQHPTPAHYYRCVIDKNRPSEFQNKKLSQSMINGKAVHILTTQKHLFNDLYTQAPSSDKRTKEYKQCIEENPNKQVLSPKDWDEVHMMSASILNHPSASFLLSEGHAEVPMFWKDPESGEKCKALVDFFRFDNHIVDIKTTYDASLNYRGFKYIVEYQLNYNWQLAHYVNGYKEIMGVEPIFSFIAVENKFPFFTHVITFKPHLVEKYKASYREALNKYIHAKNNNWPGYSPYIEEVG